MPPHGTKVCNNPRHLRNGFSMPQISTIRLGAAWYAAFSPARSVALVCRQICQGHDLYMWWWRKVHHIMQMRFTRMPWRSVLHRSLPEDCFHEESCWSCHKCEKLQCIAGIAIRASQRRLLQNRCNGNPSIVMLAAGNQPGIQIEIQSRQPAAAPNYFSIVLVCCRSLS